MTRNDALKRLGELKLRLETVLQAHTHHSIAEMARTVRPVLMAGLPEAVEKGLLDQGAAERLKRMLASNEAPAPVTAVSRLHIDAGLDDGDRTALDELLVKKIRSTLAGVEAAIAAITGSSSNLSKAEEVLDNLAALAKSVYPERFGI